MWLNGAPSDQIDTVHRLIIDEELQLDFAKSTRTVEDHISVFYLRVKIPVYVVHFIVACSRVLLSYLSLCQGLY